VSEASDAAGQLVTDVQAADPLAKLKAAVQRAVAEIQADIQEVVDGLRPSA
jgi:hypothetical protein